MEGMVESRAPLGIQVWCEEVQNIFEIEIFDVLLLQKVCDFFRCVAQVFEAEFLIQFQKHQLRREPRQVTCSIIWDNCVLEGQIIHFPGKLLFSNYPRTAKKELV